MSKRIILTVSDELAERLSRIASHYDKDVRNFLIEMAEDQTLLLEEYHEREACEQISYLVNAEPLGRA